MDLFKKSGGLKAAIAANKKRNGGVIKYTNNGEWPKPPSKIDKINKDSADARNKDWEQGKKMFGGLFGSDNPEFAKVMEQMRGIASGNDGYANKLRQSGVSGINNQMSSGLRQLRGLQATSGVRGGAALGQAIPLVNSANQARAGLESDINIADMSRRQNAIGSLYGMMSNERAGETALPLGWAGLGSQDRFGNMGYLATMGQQDLARQQLANAMNSQPGKTTNGWTDFKNQYWDYDVNKTKEGNFSFGGEGGLGISFKGNAGKDKNKYISVGGYGI